MTKIADGAKKASDFANEKIEAAREAAESALASGKAKANAAYSAS
jgi:F0F1-type ATP synthase epsilon subunit